MTSSILAVNDPAFALFPQLRGRLDHYRATRVAHDDLVRHFAVDDLSTSFRYAHGTDEVAAVSRVLLSLTDLRSNELIRFASLLPLNVNLYLTLCHHPQATNAIRLVIYDLLGVNLKRADGVVLSQHMREQHPFVHALVETRRDTFLGWAGIHVDDLCVQLGDDFALQRVAAALLDTWTGRPDDLLQTARGILASDRS